MPKAVVIEILFNTPNLDWQLVETNAHGNTVRQTFLHFAESGWTCDVRYANYNQQLGVGFYDYATRLSQTPYDLLICSWRLNEYYFPSFEQLAIPVFLVSETRTPYISGSKIYSPIIFVGGNEVWRSRRIDTWDIATNLSGTNQNAPSYANGAVAGKATKLIDAGFTTAELKDAIGQQASTFPEWNENFGYGQAPFSYTISVPDPEPIPPTPEPEPEPTPEPPFIPTQILNPITQVWLTKNP